MNLIFFDLETFGLSRNTDPILEIAAIVVNEKLEIIDTFDSFVNPQKPVPWQITQLTGITTQMIKNAPAEFVALNDFKAFMKKYNVQAIAGHNIARFDIPFLRTRCEHWNLDIVLPNEVIDTLNIAKDKHKAGLLPDYNFTTAKGNLSFKLENLMEYYDIGSQDHRAINDVKHNIMVYKNLIAKEEDYGF